jgi:hypothetical protein
MSRAEWNEERLGTLLRLLRPAPPGWVQAAAELPRLRAVLDDLLERSKADAALRAALVDDLEAALAQEGLDPKPRRVEVSRRLLSELGPG